MPVTTDPQRSLFITLFAAVASFIGLGVSILAVWILWLIPRARPAMPEVQLKKPKKDKARRRSAPPVLFPSSAASSPSPPSPLIPIITVSSQGADSSGRHVSFLDSQIRARNTRRYSAPPEAVHPDSEDFSDSSPLSSSSTLVATPPSKHVNVLTPIISEAGESSATDSDSSHRSSRSSSLLSPRMPKMKTPLMGKKTRKSSIDATNIMKERPKPTRSASLGFVDMWQRSRPQTAPEASSKLPSGSTRPQPFRRSSGSQASSPGPASASPSFSYFPFKPSRRVTNPTPVPRTQPYLYPYFAAPPIGTPQDYVQFSLQVEGTIRSTGSTTVTETSSRAVEKKEANAQAQASLGYGRRPSGRRVVSALP